MSHAQQIADLEAQVNAYFDRERAPHQGKECLPEKLSTQERIDWEAVAKAQVNYELPLDGEDSDKLAVKYIDLLREYIKTWVNKATTETPSEDKSGPWQARY